MVKLMFGEAMLRSLGSWVLAPGCPPVHIPDELILLPCFPLELKWFNEEASASGSRALERL